jgi:16S rRNA (uracil1498-N3)-methyltransferase
MQDEPAHRFLFYTSELEPSSARIELTGDEHHHATRVLRMLPGETLYVTNGRGVMARCRIEESGARATRLAVEGVEGRDSNPRPVVLALALLKKDAFERAVEQCTELGITRCIPFESEKSHIKRYPPAFIDRLRRVALSAMKQSFRPVLPDIDSVIPFDDLLVRARETAVAIVGDSSGGPLGAVFSEGPLMIIVGPEGGLADRERGALAAAGARAVSASPYRLRSETAAVSLVALAFSSRFGGQAGASHPI